MTERHEENKLISEELKLKLNQCSEDLKEKKDCFELLMDLIDEFIAIKNNAGIKAIGIESIIIGMISIILQKENVPMKKKNDYCIYWIEGIDLILKNQSFVFDSSLISNLIRQLYTNIPIDTKNKIKLVVLKFVNSYGNDGIINSIQTEIIKYLKKDSELSDSMFNTIIELSKDEKEKHIKSKEEYKSHKNDIIEKHLYSSEKTNINQFDIKNYDLKMLCNISNCGKDFNDILFSKVIKEIIKSIVAIKNDKSIHTIGTYQEYEIIRLFERELNDCNQKYESIIDLLFEDIDFSEFKNNTIKFYQKILNCFIAVYYDSYNDGNVRETIEIKIRYIEKKIRKIKNVYIRQELSKCLYLSPRTFERWNPSEIKTKYKYKDKKFLNEQLCKYGKYDIKNSMETIYLLKIDELLPEILLSVEEILKFNKENFERKFEGDTKTIIDMLITKAFINFSDDIKRESELIDAYENILKMLMKFNYEKAGVILDEFRIH